jgi:hypothetical protein
MLAEGRSFLLVAPHVAMFPGLVIFATVLGVNFLGDALRDALDVRRPPTDWAGQSAPALGAAPRSARFGPREVRER